MIDASRQLPPAPAEIERGMNALEMLPPYELRRMAEALAPLAPMFETMADIAQTLSDLAFFGAPQLPDDFDELQFRLEIVRALQSNN